jgi:adenylyl cyclase-associated protein
MSISEYKAATPPTAAGSAPPPPPPPPPPGPPPPPPLSPAPAAGGGGGVAAVFAELNRGSEVTKNLRKVDKSEMTHKNPALRASSTVPSTAGSSAGEYVAFRSLDATTNVLSPTASTKETS